MDLAEELDRACSEHQAISRFGDRLAPTLAYTVQADFVARRSRRLASPVVGYKIALTSRETQASLGGDEPASGTLLAVDVVPSGRGVPLSDYFLPLLEVEVVFRTRTRIRAQASTSEIVESCDVAAGIECPDCRYRDWFNGERAHLTVPELIADNCCAGLLITGDRWLPASSVDLDRLTAELLIDGDSVAGGSGECVLGGPVASVAWLTRRLAERGSALEADMVVASGTFTTPTRARRGTVCCRFSSGLGDARVVFS